MKNLSKIGLVMLNIFLVRWLVMIVYLLIFLFLILGIGFILNPVIRGNLTLFGPGMGIISALIGIFILGTIFKLTESVNKYMRKYLAWTKSVFKA